MRKIPAWRTLTGAVIALVVLFAPRISFAADATDALSCANAGGYCLDNAVQTVCPTGETIGGRCGTPLCCIKPAAKKPDATATPVVKPYSPKTNVVPNPLGAGSDLLTILGRVISAFIGLVGAFALLVFVYAGVRYMTAAGEEKAVTHAKETMKYAFLGLFFIIFAYVIANFFFQALVRGPETASTSPTPATLPTIPK